MSNNQANVPYTFEVINCLKNTSMFSKGMQPVLFSVAEARQGRPGWVRVGSSVCYYRNLYVPPGTANNNNSNMNSTPTSAADQDKQGGIVQQQQQRRRSQSTGASASTPTKEKPPKAAKENCGKEAADNK